MIPLINFQTYNKKNNFHLLFVTLLSLFLFTLSIPYAKANNKYASIIVEEHSGKVLFSRNADSFRFPASMAKVMTMYILFQELDKGSISLSTKLKISSRAAGQPPSKLGIKKNGTISVNNAILALVTKSANDVATAIAEKISGTEIMFAKRMTKTAKSLGMKKTTFMNASGLHNRSQKTTARDMATLAIAIKKDFSHHYHYFKTKKFKWNGKSYRNHNKLLKSYSGTDGIKTGYIDASGYNLMASVERKGVSLIGIVFGGKSGSRRDVHLMGLFNKTFPRAKTPNIIMVDAPKLRPTKVNISKPALKPILENTLAINDLPLSKPTPINSDIYETENNWGIQIGTYSKKVTAHLIALQARRVASELLKMLPAELTPIHVDGSYAWRVRFNELDESAARNICSQLLSKDISCIPVPKENILGFLVKNIEN